MLFAVAMTFIDQTIVAIASPNIQSELDLTRSGSQWVINAYLLALAATFALGGRLADVLGPRRMVLIGIVGFAGSSALCGATPKGSAAEAWLVVFRVIQGISGAIMIPAALAIVVATFPVNERGKALAIFFGVSGGLTAVGPIAGGYLTQWTWRAIFWINIPIAVLALVLTLMAHATPPRRPDRIDIPGAVLVGGGMALSVLGFEQASTWGWSSPRTIGCIVAGLVLLAVFVRVEARTASPLIKVAIFRDRAFVDRQRGAVLLQHRVRAVLLLRQRLRAGVARRRRQPGRAVPVHLLRRVRAGRADRRAHARLRRRPKPVILGCAISTVGFALWGWKITDLSLGAQWYYIVLAGAGIGLLLGTSSTDAVNRAIGASYGEVTGITQTVRNYGSTFGVAVLGTILSSVLTDRLTTSFRHLGLPASVARKVAHGSSEGSGAAGSNSSTLNRQISAAVAHDFAVATQYVAWGMAVACGIAFLFALRHPGGRPGIDLPGPDQGRSADAVAA